VLRPVQTLVDLVALGLLVLWVGSRGSAFSGFPKGYDAWGHYSKTRFVIDNWPHIAWNYEWYAGMPSFTGSYPPGYHLLVAAVSVGGSLSIPTAMTVVAFAGVLGIVIGVYATIRTATTSRFAALVGAALLAGTPTLWSQVVTVGLYPRLLGLSCMCLALAGMTRLLVNGGRLTAIGTALALAGALSMHPVVGVGALGLVSVVGLFGSPGPWQPRIARTVGIVGWGSALAGYFYLPYLLIPKSQSPWTDQVEELTWRALVWPVQGSLGGFSPLLLPLAVPPLVFAVRVLRRPKVTLADKVALGTDVSWLSSDRPLESAPPNASDAVRRLAAWRARTAVVGVPLRVALTLLACVPVVLAYGTIGYLAPHFTHFVDGLNPTDLLVYPAVLLTTAIGLALGVALRLWPQDRPGWRSNSPHRLVALAVIVTVLTVAGTAAKLPSGVRANNGPADKVKAAMLPADASGQRQYRLAGASDSTSNFLGAATDVGQVRGYQANGNPQIGYQNWLEASLLDVEKSPATRRFLLDWYGIRWIFADAGAGPLAPYKDDLATYEPLEDRNPYTELATFAYRQASPVLSARTTPTTLVIGDAAHYELVLRGLAAGDVNSRQLVAVQGPAALDDIDPTELRSFDNVLVYGATLRSPAAVSQVLADYVRGGGHLVVDDADLNGVAHRLVSTPSNPLPITATRRVTVLRDWDWTVGDDPALQGIDTASFGPPSYNDTGIWDVESGRPRNGAHALLTSGQHVVAATTSLGAGTATWSGIGLPYHSAVFQSVDEGRFLGRLLAADDSPATDPTYKATFVSSERRELTAGPAARGVLLKEHLDRDWHATVNGKDASLWSAGPGLMWVALPAHHGDVTVVFSYRLSPVEQAGYGLTGLALLVTLALALSRRLWRRMVDAPNRFG
jgi:hypothetical protein